MRNIVSQITIALVAIAIAISTHAMALPLAAQPAPRDSRHSTSPSPTCASTLTHPDAPCACLSNCTATSSCCSDFEPFSRQVLGPHSIHPPPTDAFYELLDFGQADRVPHFHKIEPALTRITPLPAARAGALVTIRTCLIEDVNRATTANGKDRKWVVKKCVRAFDVVGARSADGKVVKLTDLVRVPKQVRAAFAPAHNTSAAAYYAPLVGESAVNVYKAALTPEPLLAGFSAALRPGAKYAWDPTSRRSWRVERAQFSGTTHPIEAAVPESDVSAGQVDGDVAGVLDMSRGQVASTRDVLVKVWDAKKRVWVATVDADIVKLVGWENCVHGQYWAITRRDGPQACINGHSG